MLADGAVNLGYKDPMRGQTVLREESSMTQGRGAIRDHDQVVSSSSVAA